MLVERIFGKSQSSKYASVSSIQHILLVTVDPINAWIADSIASDGWKESDSLIAKNTVFDALAIRARR